MGESPCLVWLPVDHRLLGNDGRHMPYVVPGDKYARPVKLGVQPRPVLFPLAEPERIGALLALFDGVMRTGSPAHVGHAPDRPVEDFALRDRRAFAYAVRSHPAWGLRNGGRDAAIFAVFGESCSVRQRVRRGATRPGTATRQIHGEDDA
jgi:hypothetical protein